MSLPRTAFQRLSLALLVMTLGACGDDPTTSFPEEDATPQGDAPAFDIPTPCSATDCQRAVRFSSRHSVGEDAIVSFTPTAVCISTSSRSDV